MQNFKPLFLDTLQGTFYLDGLNELSGVTVLKLKAPRPTTIAGLGCAVEQARTTGLLKLEAFKNTILVSGAVIQIDATAPTETHLNALGISLEENDVFEIKATSVTFTPKPNRADFYILNN